MTECSAEYKCEICVYHKLLLLPFFAMYIIMIENRKHETERLFEYYLKPISPFYFILYIDKKQI